jgi:hypothetical protein
MATPDIPVRLLGQLVGDARFDLYEKSGRDTPLDKAKDLPFAVAKVLREVRAFDKSGATTAKEKAHVAAHALRHKVDEVIAVLGEGSAT